MTELHGFDILLWSERRAGLLGQAATLPGLLWATAPLDRRLRLHGQVEATQP